MRYLSVCSGIEAATQAWHPLGWKPVAFSEIEPFPSAVLAHHYPGIPNWGDMTRFEEWPDEPIDLLCGGTPCQDYSIAGKRAGMAGDRGQLTLKFVEIAARYKPRWIVWENVPGVLSSNRGRDFAAFLCDLGASGYGWAYRVLDAQHTRTRRFPFAVPQRRRRVWVVGYLGDWRRAAAVLFDRESLSGHPAPRREAGQKPAPTISARPTGGGGRGTDFDLDGGLIPSVSMCLNAGAMGRIDGESETFIPVAIQERAISEDPDAGPDGAGFRQDGAAYTLEARTVPQAVAFDGKGTEVQFSTDGSHPTLRSMGHNRSHQNAGGHAAVAFAENSRAELRLCGGDGQVVSQLTTGGGKPGQGQSTIAQPWAVRRLTPRECERLQGFPDDFTAIPWRNKPADQCPDGHRYKALGNSWAVNCAELIGERIAMVDAMAPMMEAAE